MPPLTQLREFLTLSEAQVRSLTGNVTEHQRSLQGYQQRVNELQREIAAETRREVLDPLALGTRYAEIESNCRQARNLTGLLRTRNLTVLTEAQRTRLGVLDEAIRLAPLVAEARQAAFLEGGGLGGPFGGAGFVTGGSVAFLPSLAGCIADPVYRWFDTTGFERPDPPLFALKQFLPLTDAQFVSVFRNIEEQQRTLQRRQQRILDLQREVVEETRREQPDPRELGTRYAEMEQNCRESAVENRQLRDRQVATLSPPQRARLKMLEDAAAAGPAIAEAQLVALIEGGLGIGILTAPRILSPFPPTLPGCTTFAFPLTPGPGQP